MEVQVDYLETSEEEESIGELLATMFVSPEEATDILVSNDRGTETAEHDVNIVNNIIAPFIASPRQSSGWLHSAEEPARHSHSPREPPGRSHSPEEPRHSHLPEEPPRHSHLPEEPHRHAHLPEEPPRHSHLPEEPPRHSHLPEEPPRHLQEPAEHLYHQSSPISQAVNYSIPTFYHSISTDSNQSINHYCDYSYIYNFEPESGDPNPMEPVVSQNTTQSNVTSTDSNQSINYFYNSVLESGDPNPMEIAVSQEAYLTQNNLIVLNSHTSSFHTTSELSSNYNNELFHNIHMYETNMLSRPDLQ